jgi:hypothetical protein
MTTPRSILLLTVLPLAGCGGSPDLSKYHCAKAIVGASESGGTIASSGTVAYVGGAGTIAVFDLADPANPQVLTPVPFPYPVVGLAVSGTTLVAASGQSLAVYDLADPKAPLKKSELPTGAPTSAALVTDGHWAYSGTFGANFAVYDLSGAAPTLVTQVSAGEEAITSLVLNGNTLYVGGAQPKALGVFDVSSPAQPQPLPSVDTAGYIEGMVLDDGALFSQTLQAQGLNYQRFGLGTPTAPKLEASSHFAGDNPTPVLLQVSALHGYFLRSGGIAVAGVKESDLDAQAIPVGGLCLPTQYKLQHVHAVGEAVVASGQEGIAFLSP